jgi:hypothetical protein
LIGAYDRHAHHADDGDGELTTATRHDCRVDYIVDRTLGSSAKSPERLPWLGRPGG